MMLHIKEPEKSRNECAGGREGGVCDWSSWVHSILAGKALAPPWLHCQSHPPQPKSVPILPLITFPVYGSPSYWVFVSVCK